MSVISRWFVVFPILLLPTTVFAQSCESLRSYSISDVSVDATQVVASGEYLPPGAATTSRSRYQGLPEFCRVSLTLTPSADSNIKTELWLPTQTWNGKFLAVGNAAFTGSVRHSSMAMPLSRGYAVSSTDTGHLGNTASFALGHPEKLTDFGWRAIHEMTVTSKAIIDSYYANRLRYSYFTGCSAGGRQAMKAAQQFPEDFDGIVAGAPGLDWTGRAGASLRIATHLQANPDARLLQSDRELLYQQALNSCDANDGIEDGLISMPEQCEIDFEVLQCDANSGASCLSEAQIATAKMIYSSPVNPQTGRAITGLLPGSELGWTDMGWTASARATGLEQFRYLVYEDESWTIDRFEFDRDIALAESKDGDTLNALNTDLSGFLARNGKLIAYHGWSDPQISPANITQYYQRVSDEFGGREEIHDSMRLFMAPGMGHCVGGPGPNSFDSLTALEHWVENGNAPDTIVAEHRSGEAIDRSRPLCPYPEVAMYSGADSIDEAENFVCRVQ